MRVRPAVAGLALLSAGVAFAVPQPPVAPPPRLSAKAPPAVVTPPPRPVVRAATVDFNRDIRPVLATQCYACHGPDGKARKADLRLDQRDNAVETGAIVPGKPAESKLLQRITSHDPDEVMPPVRSKKPPLTQKQIELFRQWIAEGAKYSEHWSFAKLSRPQVPAVGERPGSWGRNPIDAFILDRLDREGLKPSPEADRVTLCRRLYFDLTGLPPTPEEVAAFVNDRSPDAYEKLVERLLASPHYGERMATFWLDLVRYADSIGYHSDVPMNVSPFRDYVIRSFNANMPFDRFTIEQLAGDLLPKPTLEQRVASAYNRLLQTTEEGGGQNREYEVKYASDRVRNFGQVWLGGTLMCSECHNHKFDPYTQKDFYSVAAFFADIQEPAVGRREPGMLVPSSPEQEKELRWLTRNAAVAKARLDAAAAAFASFADAFEGAEKWPNPTPRKGAATVTVPADVIKILATPAEKWTQPNKDRLAAFARDTAPDLKADRDALAAATKARTGLESTLPRVLVTKAGPPRVVRILSRGNWLDTTGAVMTPNTPDFLPPLPQMSKTQARYTRLDLARWTVSPQNPLTARVFVNRTWKLYFGHGIARSLEESGSQGELPTHPELLDWLASEFMNPTIPAGAGRARWDVKHLVRLMVLSSAYRQSSVETPALREKDPANKLLARQSRWRLDAEFVRDDVLAISGLLVRTIGGPSVKPYQPPGYWAALNFPPREWQKDTGDKVYRRGMYTHWQRTFPHPAMVALDAPSREEAVCERPRSNIPQQALVLLNDPEFVEAARAFAAKTLTEGGNDDSARVQWAFRRATGRAPQPKEANVLLSVLHKHHKEYVANPAAATQLLKVGDAPMPGNMSAVELAAWTSVCRVILNLHETITRE